MISSLVLYNIALLSLHCAVCVLSARKFLVEVLTTLKDWSNLSSALWSAVSPLSSASGQNL